MIGLVQPFALERSEQDTLCFVGAHIVIAIDMSVACAMLQWDAPLPPSRASSGTGIRLGRPIPLARNRHCSIGRKPVAPILERGFENDVDQQTAKTSAIDKEIALNRTVPVQP